MTAGTKHQALTIVAPPPSSLTSLAPGIYSTHVLAPPEFGLFALIQFVYVLVLGVLRSSFTEVALVSGAAVTAATLMWP